MPYIFYSLVILLLSACGSGLCPLGSSHRTICAISGSGVVWVSPVGVLDTSLNGTGIVTTAIGANGDNGYSLAIQSDGKILFGGTALFGGSTDFAMARYHTDGSLDTSFGTGGIVTTAIGPADLDDAYSLIVQPDGKILLGGFARFAGQDDFAIVRYNTNGSLDTSFGTAGIVTTAATASHDRGQSLILQPDGKILLGGSADTGGFNFDFAIARYHANGSLDTSFGTGGIVTTAIGSGNDEGISLVLQPDGKIILGGYSDMAGNYDFSIARYNSNGSLDTSFNTTGIVTTPIGVSGDYAETVALQPDGKILLGGNADIGANADFVFVRYNSNGSLDTSLNGTGIVITTVIPGTDVGETLAVQPDGKILFGGWAGFPSDFVISRYNSNGTLDTTFNVTGTITTPIGVSFNAAETIALQPDGKILLGGFARIGATDDFAFVRYR